MYFLDQIVTISFNDLKICYWKHDEPVRIVALQILETDLWIEQCLSYSNTLSVIEQKLPPDQKCWQHSSEEITTQMMPTLLVRRTSSIHIK